MLENVKIDLNNLTEKELREINKASQEKLDAIKAEKKRKAKLKKDYTLKEVPPTFKVDYSRLGGKIEAFFKDPSRTILDISSFYELRKQCTDEIKPSKKEIYSCPHCGKFNLSVGDFGALREYDPRYAVTCNSCEFTVKKKETTTWDAWETFHKWLIKHGYLDESVKFDY